LEKNRADLDFTEAREEKTLQDVPTTSIEAQTTAQHLNWHDGTVRRLQKTSNKAIKPTDLAQWHLAFCGLAPGSNVTTIMAPCPN
jgi:hypothetical protein